MWLLQWAGSQVLEPESVDGHGEHVWPVPGHYPCQHDPE